VRTGEVADATADRTDTTTRESLENREISDLLGARAPTQLLDNGVLLKGTAPKSALGVNLHAAYGHARAKRAVCATAKTKWIGFGLM